MKVKLELEAMNCLCELDKFIINGKKANYYDFGDKMDIDPNNAEDYSCGNMVFLPKLATNGILNKYNINNDEYAEICEQLTEKLSFGSCGWCV